MDHDNGDPKQLKLQTDLAGMPMVSMLPTPVVGSNGWPEPVTAPQYRDHRNASASFVPDVSTSTHTNLMQGRPQPAVKQSGVNLSRSDTLNIPKRRTNSAHLGRSLSVGGPQRMPSTVLHRELKADTIIETPPASVYVAGTRSGYQTAWTQVRDAGKGSFSKVILARPASEFVKPEYIDYVDAASKEAIADLGISDPADGQADASAAADVGPASSATTESTLSRSVLVAVKITTLNRNADAELHLFKRDLDIMLRLPRFPSLIRLIAWSLDEQVHKRGIFVTPYCSGGDLFDLIAKHRSKLSVMLLRRIFADICSAVAFLHKNNIVHRDVKLENVLLNVQTNRILTMTHPESHGGAIAVLTDLGLARRIDPSNPMLTTRCGSDDYVPPEIMMGQPYDGRETDSWALGVLLYAMMEGRLPFDPPPHVQQYDGRRARLRTAHRIARVDWAWYKRQNLTPEESDWQGGKEVVEGCLTRRHNRRLASDTLKLPWVADAVGPDIHEDYLNGEPDDDDIWKVFVQY